MKRWQKNLLIVLAVILVIVLIGPFLIPVPELDGLKTEKELADADSKFIEINNVIVHYKEMGQGDATFILLHGFGASVFSWHEVLQPFSQYGRSLHMTVPPLGLRVVQCRETGRARTPIQRYRMLRCCWV
jgi:hypothetical protein